MKEFVQFLDLPGIASALLILVIFLGLAGGGDD